MYNGDLSLSSSVVWNCGWDDCMDFLLEFLLDESVLRLLGNHLASNTLSLHDKRQLETILLYMIVGCLSGISACTIYLPGLY